MSFLRPSPIRRKLDDSFSWVYKKTCKANFITYVLTQITITICIFGAIYMTKFTSSIDRGTWPTNILMASGSGVGGSGSTAALLIMERLPWPALFTTSIISKGEKAFTCDSLHHHSLSFFLLFNSSLQVLYVKYSVLVSVDPQYIVSIRYFTEPL